MLCLSVRHNYTMNFNDVNLEEMTAKNLQCQQHIM